MSEATLDDLAQILRDCLEHGRSVEIDGLGTFRVRNGVYQFDPDSRRKVFLAYAAEDAPHVDRIYDGLEARGLDPWMDRRRLLAGQNWPCFSRLSCEKRGRFHAELRYALDCAVHQPLDRVFIMPVRLDDCDVPRQIIDQLQYVDLFPDFEIGLDRLAGAIRSETWQE
jgi:hypothetical protein